MATRQTSMCDSATVPAGRVTRKKVIDFRKLTTIKLPKRHKLAKRATDGRLYDIEVLEKCDGRVKIHYVGYRELYDEWRLESEIVVKNLTVQHDTQDGGGAVCVTVPYVFSLYRELALRIKQCLTSSRKSSPVVKIEMSFDKVQYDGGLKLYGQLKCTRRGNTVYTIQQYSDLDNLLGMNWHWRCLNEAGDFCFVNLSTVSFYLRKRRPLVELVPDSLPNSFKNCVHDQGYTLVFSFVREDGVQSQIHTFC